MSKKIFVKSYGCQMNFYDSNRMTDLMKSFGYQITSKPDEANLIVLNTCHIREKSSEKIYSEIGRIKKIKNIKLSEGKDCKLIIAGCVAQAEGKEMILRAPVVDAIVGPQSYHNLPEIVKKIDEKRKKIISTNFDTKNKFDKLNFLKPSSSSAFVTVQEGCDKFCTFCVVPYTRGYEYSRPIKDILNEINKYAKLGVKEVTLLGQNVNAYHGLDTDNNEKHLDYLINKISEIDSISRIRYMTSHPLDMNETLIKCHGTNEKLMPFIHLPVQSGSNKILKKMNRKYTVEDYYNVIYKLKSIRDDVALSSDFIVGFPGENDDDFNKTLELIKKIKFSIAYSFMYSARPGTPASTLNNQIDVKIKKERLSILQSLLKKQQKDYNSQFNGKKLHVLVEKKGRYKDQYVGRSIYNQSIFMNSKKNIIGSIVNTKIIGNTNFALSAELTL